MVLTIAAGILLAVLVIMLLRSWVMVLCIIVLLVVYSSAHSEVSVAPMIGGRIMIPQSEGEYRFMGPNIHDPSNYYSPPLPNPPRLGSNPYRSIVPAPGHDVPCKLIPNGEEYWKCMDLHKKD